MKTQTELYSRWMSQSALLYVFRRAKECENVFWRSLWDMIMDSEFLISNDDFPIIDKYFSTSDASRVKDIIRFRGLVNKYQEGK